MRYTLLEIVQRVLDATSGDEVSTIGETPMSLTVANIVKQCYFDIVGELAMAEEEGLYKLDASADNTKPTLMYVPTNVSRIQWLKYNTGETEQKYDIVNYRDQEEFLYYMTGLDSVESNISTMSVTINGKSFTFKYYNDRMPTYYTIYDDYYVIFDAYDSTVETTLTENRSLIFASLIPTFTLSDSFVPDIDPRQFQLLINESISQAAVELNQAQNPVSERRARTNKISAQRNKRDNNPGWANQEHAQFGRNGRNGFPRNSIQRAMRQSS